MGLGRLGEELAARALRYGGFAVIARNWHCVAGEADLVAARDGEYYFFEVRTRRCARSGDETSPEASITPRKRARMATVARAYMGVHCADSDPPWRLSSVAVELDRAGRLLRISLYPDLDAEPLTLAPDVLRALQVNAA